MGKFAFALAVYGLIGIMLVNPTKEILRDRCQVVPENSDLALVAVWPISYSAALATSNKC